MAHPVWKEAPVEAGTSGPVYAKRWVLLCELENVTGKAIEKALPLSNDILVENRCFNEIFSS